MKNAVGGLLAFLTLMVSAMALYINLGAMLYDEQLSLIHTLASGLFLLVWAGLAAYALTHRGRLSLLLNAYWFAALAGAAFCVITVSGMTRAFAYAAYALLFLLTPLFGLRVVAMSHLAWSGVMAGISLCYAIAGIAASNRRSAESESETEPEPESTPTDEATTDETTAEEVAATDVAEVAIDEATDSAIADEVIADEAIAAEVAVADITADASADTIDTPPDTPPDSPSDAPTDAMPPDTPRYTPKH